MPKEHRFMASWLFLIRDYKEESILMLVTLMIHMYCYTFSGRMGSVRIRLKLCWHSFDFQSTIFLFSNLFSYPTFLYVLTAKKSNWVRVKWSLLNDLLFLCGNNINNKPFLIVFLKYKRLSVVTLLCSVTSELRW